jgi:hypothetical protein
MLSFTRKTVFDQLLGSYSGEEENDLLAVCFSSDENAEKYRSFRDELIESYLRKELTTADEQRFETHFLTDDHNRELFEFAKILRENLKELSFATDQPEIVSEKKPFASWMIPAFAAVVLAASVFIIWQINRGNPQRPIVAEVTPTRSVPDPIPDSVPTTNPPINRQVPTPTPSESPDQHIRSVTFALSLMGKGGDEDVLRVGSKTVQVNLMTSLPEKDFLHFPAYIVEIRNDKKSALFTLSLKQLKARGNDLIIPVPATSLKSGKLTFIISGKNADGTVEELGGTERVFSVKKEAE